MRTNLPIRHSREGGNPGGFVFTPQRQPAWIPAFAGMTDTFGVCEARP